MIALCVIATTILVILGVRALLDWLCKLVELHDACSERENTPWGDVVTPPKRFSQAPDPLGVGSRGGESHVRTAPAASLISFHGRTISPGAAQDHG